MAYVVLVTGGSRSGKSRYALKFAESLEGPRAFVATCPIIDDEMRERISKHIQDRVKANWHAVEESIDLAAALHSSSQYRVLVVDCLTLWINNILYHAEKSLETINEEHIARKCLELLHVSVDHKGTIIFVSNEVGMGIVPENPQVRLFRDLVGRCNQTIAQGADEVTLLCCGLPIHLKKGKTT